MSKKYYAKFVNGIPVEGSLKSFPNNPGYPYKELSIPDCCPVVTENPSFTSTISFQAPGCIGGWVFTIDNVVQVPDPEIPLDQDSIPDYVAYLNLAYAGILSFEVISGDTIKITILVPFTDFRVTASWSCE